jgi:hypothetical protein
MGQLGKRNQKKVLGKFLQSIRREFLALAVALLLNGCGGDLGEPLQSGRVIAWQGWQGRWVGSVIATDPTCGSETRGLMTIGDKGFGFDPFASTAVIQGQVTPDGKLTGTLARQGPDHQNLSLAFEGVASGSESITGVLRSGRCHWTVTLRRG